VSISGTIVTGATLDGVDLTGSTGTPVYAGVDFATTTCPDGQLAPAPLPGAVATCQGHPWP
jgi:hypothetical protein